MAEVICQLFMAEIFTKRAWYTSQLLTLQMISHQFKNSRNKFQTKKIKKHTSEVHFQSNLLLHSSLW